MTPPPLLNPLKKRQIPNPNPNPNSGDHRQEVKNSKTDVSFWTACFFLAWRSMRSNQAGEEKWFSSAEVTDGIWSVSILIAGEKRVFFPLNEPLTGCHIPAWMDADVSFSSEKNESESLGATISVFFLSKGIYFYKKLKKKNIWPALTWMTNKTWGVFDMNLPVQWAQKRNNRIKYEQRRSLSK